MSSGTLGLQDPSGGGGNLLDAIAHVAKDADSGGGFFAFASVNGVEMLFKDKYLRRLAKSRGFELVVGVDSITNRRTLDSLSDLARRLPKLNVRALLHETPTLFHPKLCWFAEGGRLTLVVGSGNLTPGGLMTNFEAFVVCPLDGAAAAAAKSEIDDFSRRWDHRLLRPDDPAALARAAKNTGSERSLLKKMASAPEFPPAAPSPPVKAQVLVAEISKNVDERTQLDVGIDVFTGFFGARPEGGHILIQPVDSRGRLEDVEIPRAIFPTKSHNYRFEARAGAGLKYPPPGSGRPFGVFVRMPDGIFRYHLLWPGDTGYPEIDSLLTKRVGPPPKKRPMRRETLTVADLAAAWPGSPLLKALGRST
jgi:hypothetical protein